MCCICSSRNITTTWYGKSVKITKITLHKTFNLQPNLTIFLLNSFYNDLSPYKKNHRLISHISHLAATYCRMWKWKIFAMCSMCSPRCSPGLVMCTQTEALNFWIYLTVTNRVVARKFECQRGEEKKHILYKTRGLHAKGIRVSLWRSDMIRLGKLVFYFIFSCRSQLDKSLYRWVLGNYITG